MPALEASNLNVDRYDKLHEPMNSVKKRISIYVQQSHTAKPAQYMQDSITYYVNYNHNISESDLKIIQFWCPEFTSTMNTQNKNYLYYLEALTHPNNIGNLTKEYCTPICYKLTGAIGLFHLMLLNNTKTFIMNIPPEVIITRRCEKWWIDARKAVYCKRLVNIYTLTDYLSCNYMNKHYKKIYDILALDSSNVFSKMYGSNYYSLLWKRLKKDLSSIKDYFLRKTEENEMGGGSNTSDDESSTEPSIEDEVPPDLIDLSDFEDIPDELSTNLEGEEEFEEYETPFNVEGYRIDDSILNQLKQLFEPDDGYYCWSSSIEGKDYMGLIKKSSTTDGGGKYPSWYSTISENDLVEDDLLPTWYELIINNVNSNKYRELLYIYNMLMFQIRNLYVWPQYYEKYAFQPSMLKKNPRKNIKSWAFLGENDTTIVFHIMNQIKEKMGARNTYTGDIEIELPFILASSFSSSFKWGKGLILELISKPENDSNIRMLPFIPSKDHHSHFVSEYECVYCHPKIKINVNFDGKVFGGKNIRDEWRKCMKLCNTKDDINEKYIRKFAAKYLFTKDGNSNGNLGAGYNNYRILECEVISTSKRDSNGGNFYLEIPTFEYRSNLIWRFISYLVGKFGNTDEEQKKIKTMCEKFYKRKLNEIVDEYNKRYPMENKKGDDFYG